MEIIINKHHWNKLIVKINQHFLEELVNQGECLLSNAGPWKKSEDVDEDIPEDILKRRKEIIYILILVKFIIY